MYKLKEPTVNFMYSMIHMWVFLSSDPTPKSENSRWSWFWANRKNNPLGVEPSWLDPTNPNELLHADLHFISYQGILESVDFDREPFSQLVETAGLTRSKHTAQFVQYPISWGYYMPRMLFGTTSHRSARHRIYFEEFQTTLGAIIKEEIIYLHDFQSWQRSILGKVT